MSAAENPSLSTGGQPGLSSGEHSPSGASALPESPGSPPAADKVNAGLPDPGAEDAPIKLPPLAPPRPPSSGERTDRALAVLDGLLVLSVLALSFLLASFAARNGDLWLHLASGRLLAEGNYKFGVDPFAHTTAGVNWVNPSW